MMTAESTVLEKLFHEDHPMGGRGTGICLAAGVSFPMDLPFAAMEGGSAAWVWSSEKSYPK
jgi:hypothetical protein